MPNTRSTHTADPAPPRKKKPNPEPIRNQIPVAADKPKSKPKAKARVSAVDTTSKELEKISKKPKALQAPSPDTELSNGDQPPAPARKRRHALTVAPRDPLPDRGTARQDIGGPDRKRAKRTTAQVQEDIARKEEIKQQLEEMEAEKFKLLARMELAQERDEAEEEASAVRGFEDEFTPRASHNSSPDEDFVEVNDGSDGDDGDDVVSPARSSKPKHKKRTNPRGKTRAAINIMKDSLLSTPAPAKLKRKGADVAGPAKAAKREKPTVPNGIIPNWQQKQLHAKPESRAAPKIPIPLGGLDDEDAYAPGPEEQDVLGRLMKQRKNTLIEISDSEDDETVRPSKAKNPKRVESKTITVVKTEQGTTQKRVVVVKAEASSPHRHSDDALDELTQLPPFARAAYASVFLPTLYHRLGCSESPFKEFSKGDEMVAVVQEVVDRVWPGSDWQVRWGDKLCSLAYARSGEIHSRFGSRGLAAIVNHFSLEPYKSAYDRTGIIDYASWAMQDDGPGLYKYPAPANTNSKDPDYQDPDGIFESPYCVDVMKWFIKIIQASVGNYGHPRGAIALTATAIERGFTAFIKGGEQQVSPRFAHEFFSSQCEEYYELAGGLSENNWLRIMATYGLATPAAAFKSHAKKSSLSTNRHNLFIRGSSPIVE